LCYFRIFFDFLPSSSLTRSDKVKQNTFGFDLGILVTLLVTVSVFFTPPTVVVVVVTVIFSDPTILVVEVTFFYLLFLLFYQFWVYLLHLYFSFFFDPNIFFLEDFALVGFEPPLLTLLLFDFDSLGNPDTTICFL